MTSPPGGSANPLPGLRVLLAEPDAAMAERLRGCLEAEGCQVFSAHDGALAALLASGTVLDLLVTDLALPGLDGARLVRSVRSLRPWLPVLIFTEAAAVDSALVQRSWEGPLLVVPRGTGPDGLLAGMRTVLARRGLASGFETG